MSEPTTAAGRALYNAFDDVPESMILAIEAEARAAALDEAHVAVEVMNPRHTDDEQSWTDPRVDGFNAAKRYVLAAIDALREGER